MYKFILLLVLLLSWHPRALRAQTTNASITGRVTDPLNATIAGAKVGAVNTGTNFRYETATNGAGEYTLANLAPGTYRIEMEKSGFKLTEDFFILVFVASLPLVRDAGWLHTLIFSGPDCHQDITLTRVMDRAFRSACGNPTSNSDKRST